MEFYLVVYCVGIAFIGSALPSACFERDRTAEFVVLLGLGFIILAIIMHHYDAIMEFIGSILYDEINTTRGAG